MVEVKKKFNAAIIGAGRFAQRVIIPKMQETGNYNPVAIYSRSLEKAKSISAKFSAEIKAYDNAEEMLKDENIDVVYISTPPHTHLEYVEIACNAGKKIICEKPVTRTIEQAKRLLEIVRKTKTTLLVNYTMTNHPAQQKILELVRGGTIGCVVKGRVHFGFYFPLDDWDWRIKRDTGGGPMMDLGIHCINFLHCIFGKVTRVEAQEHRKIFPQMECSESVSALLKHKDECFSVIEVSFAYNANMVEVTGENGSLIGLTTFGWPAGGEILHLDKEGNKKIYQAENVDPFSNTLNRFAELFRSRESGYEDEYAGAEAALNDLIVASAALGENT